MIDWEGFATPEGTRRFAEDSDRPESSYRTQSDLTLSTLGLGTYLGDPNEETDRATGNAVVDVLENGVNHIDTAINYRYQRSERSIRRGLEMWRSRGGKRESVVVSSKGGFIPFDGEKPLDPSAYVMETFVEPGIVPAEEIVNGHCLHPDYLEHQVQTSRENLGLETLDLYYLHNPETQLSTVGREDLFRKLERAFERMETLVDRGWIRRYGAATWNAFRNSPGDDSYLKLDRLLATARRAGGEDHRFEAIQLPFNLGMHEAYTRATQRDQSATPLEVASDHDLAVMVSAPLLQGQLAGGLPEELSSIVEGFDTDAQRALQIARSAPGVTAALVGMKDPEHRRENLAVMDSPPLEISEYNRLFEPV